MVIKIISVIAILCIVIYSGGGTALYIFQRNMLYVPSPYYDHNFETFELRNDGQALKITILNPGQPRAIIYFGGNAEPVIFNAEPFIENLSGYTIYLSNYRGYGGSTGVPTELGLYSDALALYDRVRSQHDSIYLLGRSLGSGVATYLASQREINRLALITPYDSIAKVAQAYIPIYPINLLIKDHYDSKKRAQDISAKVLIVMAEFDEIIPNSHSIKLSQSFADSQVSTLLIEGANHNNVSLDAQYFPALKQFFDTKAEP